MLNLEIVVLDEFKPVYANDTDACMDLRSTEDVEIQPGEVKVLNSGVQVAIPKEHVMEVFVRSSVGIKKNLMLANGTGIIDAGYRDPIKMALYNFGKDIQYIKKGDRICQFLILPRPKINLIQVEDDENFRKSDRGGGIGSTGK